MKHLNLLRYLTIFLLVFSFSGCTLFRTETNSSEVKKEETVISNDVVLEGVAAGVPFKATIKHKGRSDTNSNTDKQETKDTSSPATNDLFGYIIGIVLGGGVGGFAIKTLKDRMIKRMTEGVQEYIDNSPEKEAEKLKTHLSKKLDRSDKNLIKKIKNK